MNNHYKTTLLLLSCAIVFLCGCPGVPVKPPSPVSGFVAFDSPRSFDGPGQIYRVDPAGIIWHVGALSIQPKSGFETTLKIETKADWSLESLLKTLGVAASNYPAMADLELKRVREGTLASVNGTREWVDDTDKPEDKATALLANTTYHADNTYFLIRETIATTNLDYTSTNKWIIDMNLQAQLTSFASISNSLNIDREGNVSLVTTFPQPMRVWYLAERLAPQRGLGVGPFAVPSFKLVPAAKGEFRLPAERPTLMP